MEVLQISNSNRTMSSLEIATIANRAHKEVMRAIRNMEPAWEKVTQRKFALGSYADKNGQQRPCYILQRDECLFIATKFNDEARARLIRRWEELETGQAKPAVYQQPKSGAELMLMYAQQMVEQERKLLAIENRANEQERRLQDIEQRVNGTVPYTTIIGFGNRYGLRIPREKACALGRVATNLCKKYGFEMGQVQDPRFGWVKTYPDGVLSETFGKYYQNISF